MSACADGGGEGFRSSAGNSIPSPPPTKSACADGEGEGQDEGASEQTHFIKLYRFDHDLPQQGQWGSLAMRTVWKAGAKAS
jgi:hypothetical protein